MIRRTVRDLSAGNPGPQIASYADDAVLIFPGDNDWSGAYRGKEAVAGFLRRFAQLGLRGEAEDILVNGPPWRTRVAVIFPVQATDDSGAVVYDNRACLYAHARWGKITFQEDFEDTIKAGAFLRDLHSRGESAATRGQ
ncbi:MAG TPA: nuclear transport factor 2 family protein [Trebonia sp.]|nr:nuclear transport factor 2 family protein [Trebonia sp.]